MNNRSGWLTFSIFLFLAVLILLQGLSLKQADRLSIRLHSLIDNISDIAVSGRRIASLQTGSSSTDTIQDEYPGDDGDWLIWSLAVEPATLNDLHDSGGIASRWIVSGNIFQSLLEYDPDKFKLRPFIAESYEVSEDGLQIDFIIKKNVHFSDGHPLTADDVIFTYKTIINPKVDAASYANYYQNIKTVVKIDDLRVRFLMKEVYFKSLEFAGGMPIFPKHIYEFDDAEKFNKHISNPVGSGPFAFEKWDVGQKIVLRRNENYWGKKPKIKKIIYKIITNDTAAIQSLRSGETDYLRPASDQFTDLAKDKTFKKDFYCLSYWTPAAGYFWIGWNQNKPFFKDLQVRLAMTHIIDREMICKSLLRNPDALVPTGTFYIFGPQSDPNIKPWPYDLEKAKELLDQAGWIDTDDDGVRDKNGVPFSFSYMIVGGTYLHEQIAKLVKDQAAKVGIDMSIDPYEWSVFIQKVQSREFDAVNMAWGSGLAGDPYQIWHSSQIGTGSNYIGFDNPQADAIIEQARRTLDDDKRNKLYHRFHRILHEEQPYTFVYTRPEQRFLDKRFQNVIMHKLGLDPHEWYVPLAEQKYK